MIKLKLSRDETRCIEQYYFPYLDLYCETKQRDALQESEKLMHRVLIDLYHQVKRVIQKSLVSDKIKFTLKFTDSQAIILHKLLLTVPLQEKDFYIFHLRQKICDVIYHCIINALVKEKPQ